MLAVLHLIGLTTLENYINDFKGTHRLEVNKFINSTYRPGFKSSITEFCNDVDENFGMFNMPNEFDWRSKGVITPVKNQGDCGSCWSFSATGAMESIYTIKTGIQVSFSEQELIDCSNKYNDMGCNGGTMTGAFRYAIDNGICHERDVPYDNTTHSCMKDSCKNKSFFTDCKILPSAAPLKMLRYIQNQPLSVAIQANHPMFKFYKSGIITSIECGDTPDHGVLIVGYGSENGIDYWLVKNSWGTDWGDHGYVKIGRDVSENKYGVCGITREVSFPQF